jgi:hypothetical protein
LNYLDVDMAFRATGRFFGLGAFRECWDKHVTPYRELYRKKRAECEDLSQQLEEARNLIKKLEEYAELRSQKRNVYEFFGIKITEGSEVSVDCIYSDKPSAEMMYERYKQTLIPRKGTTLQLYKKTILRTVRATDVSEK